ncbi:hypothetical protein ANME2D_03140 [Candidatus Methanoperedens nitroreducens]|uniref:Uncharacterized protein n=1 Tax=Candidatus Methanoperedens nitratireducens TaxID=1392998 RepID=A0A062V3B8_9EURY|nr:hypothetical protein ANME2D_03140 [Candidatus Methanoperedens nitroreducens]
MLYSCFRNTIKDETMTKNIYFKMGIGSIILSVLLFLMFAVTAEGDYGMIWSITSYWLV